MLIIHANTIESISIFKAVKRGSSTPAPAGSKKDPLPAAQSSVMRRYETDCAVSASPHC